MTKLQVYIKPTRLLEVWIWQLTRAYFCQLTIKLTHFITFYTQHMNHQLSDATYPGAGLSHLSCHDDQYSIMISCSWIQRNTTADYCIQWLGCEITCTVCASTCMSSLSCSSSAQYSSTWLVSPSFLYFSFILLFILPPSRHVLHFLSLFLYSFPCFSSPNFSSTTWFPLSCPCHLLSLFLLCSVSHVLSTSCYASSFLVSPLLTIGYYCTSMIRLSSSCSSSPLFASLFSPLVCLLLSFPCFFLACF